MLTRYANPRRFLELSARLLPWMAAGTLLTFAGGLYLALLASPADYQQGETVRIMYVHVPAAWMAMGAYAMMAICSVVYLSLKHPLADLASRCAAPLGAMFAALTLVTGSMWGKPMWGAWWVWDARLTSMLVLFFLYLGYIAIAQQSDRDAAAQRTCAVIALIGALNLPVIKWSVEWWNTLHQPASLLRLSGPSIAGPMLWPLMLMALAHTLFFGWMLLLAMRTKLLTHKASRPARLGVRMPGKEMPA